MNKEARKRLEATTRKYIDERTLHPFEGDVISAHRSGAEAGYAEGVKAAAEALSGVSQDVPMWMASPELKRKVLALLNPPSEGGRKCGICYEGKPCNFEACPDDREGGSDD